MGTRAFVPLMQGMSTLLAAGLAGRRQMRASEEGGQREETPLHTSCWDALRCSAEPSTAFCSAFQIQTPQRYQDHLTWKKHRLFL